MKISFKHIYCLFLGELDEPVFQQDNAPIYASRLIKESFRYSSVQVLDWIPQSQDLNPIECLCRHLEKSYHRPVQPSSIQQVEHL